MTMEKDPALDVPKFLRRTPDEEAAAPDQQGDGNETSADEINTDAESLAAAESGNHIPAKLTGIDRWITWRYDDERHKLPTTRWSDPANWLTFEKAKRRAPEPKKGGVGFVFTDDDMIGGVDLDACRDPDTGKLTEWAQEVLERFPSYTEVSPSGTGIKIFADGAVPRLPSNVIPMDGESIDGKEPQIEAYVSGRFFAVTGDKLPDSPNDVQGGDWLWLHERLKKVAEGDRKQVTPAAGRNDYLFKLASSLRARGAPEDDIWRTLMETNEKADPALHPGFAEGPLDVHELKTIFRSALKFEEGTAYGVALTDVGNGERLVARHGEDLLYCYPWKTWLVFDGKRFRRDDQGAVIIRAKDTAAAIYQEAAEVATRDENKAKLIAKHAAASQQRSRLEAMVFLAQSEVPVMVEDLDTNNELLNLENGTLDLQSLTLREHRREDRLTKLAPVTLDGEAKCPTWDAFLERIFDGDSELITFMQRVIGYTLTGSVEEHVFFLLHGTGANGKTTLVRTIATMLGDYAKPVRVEALLASDRSRTGAPNEDVANLFGVRMASTSEPDEQFRLNEGVIKALTGGDTLSARRLHEQLFEFEPTHKLFLAANHKPEIRGVDEGIWRRVALIPFDVTIPEDERDPDLPAKLKAELRGILNWAVEGLRAFRAEGLNPPEKVLAAKEEYREEQDILADFLKAECELGKNHYAITKDLTEAYNEFTGAEAVRPQTFAKLLKARGFRKGLKKVDGVPKRIWQGLRLVRPASEYDERNPPPEDVIPF